MVLEHAKAGSIPPRPNFQGLAIEKRLKLSLELNNAVTIIPAKERVDEDFWNGFVGEQAVLLA